MFCENRAVSHLCRVKYITRKDQRSRVRKAGEVVKLTKCFPHWTLGAAIIKYLSSDCNCFNFYKNKCVSRAGSSGLSDSITDVKRE